MSYPESQHPASEVSEWTGVGTSKAMAHWIIPTAWAYSSRWNNRRLEHHFYGVWNIVFRDLIADLAPSVFVVPQFQINSINHGPVGPDDSIATAAQADATEFTPDFSIVKTNFTLRRAAIIANDHDPSTSWNDIIVKASVVLFIAELKRPPTRRSPSLELFLDGLITYFEQAYQCLEKQVDNAFAMQSAKVDRIILVACVGEWWTWKMATRNSYNVAPNDASDKPSNDILPSFFAVPTPPTKQPLRQQPPRKPKNDNARRKYITPPDEHFLPSDKQPYNPHKKGEGRKKERSDQPIRYTDLGAHLMEPVRTNVELARPRDDKWSRYILLGSPASDQQLSFIHRFLSTECDPMLGDVSDDNEVPVSEEENNASEDDEDDDNGDEDEDDDGQ